MRWHLMQVHPVETCVTGVDELESKDAAAFDPDVLTLLLTRLAVLQIGAPRQLLVPAVVAVQEEKQASKLHC